MPQLTDSEKLTVCALVIADQPLPSYLQEKLFPTGTRPLEAAKECKATVAQALTPAIPALGEQSPEPMLFDIEQCAEKLNISVMSVRRLVRQKRLRRVPNFGKILVSADELKRFLRQL